MTSLAAMAAETAYSIEDETDEGQNATMATASAGPAAAAAGPAAAAAPHRPTTRPTVDDRRHPTAAAMSSLETGTLDDRASGSTPKVASSSHIPLRYKLFGARVRPVEFRSASNRSLRR